MLMQERQIALNDIVVACRDAADYYSANKDMVEDAAVASLFDRLAAEHQAVARVLATHVRELGALPREPDADREQIRHLVSRLKAKFSVNESLTVLDEQLEAEGHIEALVAAVLQFELPDKTREYLGAVRDKTREGHRQLAAAKQRLADTPK